MSRILVPLSIGFMVLLAAGCNLTPTPPVEQCPQRNSLLEVIWQQDESSTPIFPFEDKFVCFDTDRGFIQLRNATNGAKIWERSIGNFTEYRLFGDTIVGLNTNEIKYININANTGDIISQSSGGATSIATVPAIGRTYIVSAATSDNFTDITYTALNFHTGETFTIGDFATTSPDTFYSPSSTHIYHDNQQGDILVISYGYSVPGYFKTAISGYRLSDKQRLWHLQSNEVFGLSAVGLVADKLIIYENGYKAINPVTGTEVNYSYLADVVNNVMLSSPSFTIDGETYYRGFESIQCIGTSGQFKWNRQVRQNQLDFYFGAFKKGNDLYLVGQKVDFNNFDPIQYLQVISNEGWGTEYHISPQFKVDCATDFRDVIYHPVIDALIINDDLKTYAAKVPE